jgi:Fic family protein
LARGIRGSNSIEGLTVSDDDAAAAVDGEQPNDIAPEAPSWQAVIGYRAAMTHAVQQGSDPDAVIDATLRRSLHFMMMSYEPTKHPGSWGLDIHVHDGRIDKIVYDAPPREEVPRLIAELVSSVRKHDSSPLIVAAMAHLNLAMIHPFSDGNGRMARCLQTLVLARVGVLDPVFCSVEEWLGVPKNTDGYYAVLALVGQGSWNPGNDSHPWVRFMLKAHFQQAATFERRNQEVSAVWEAIEQRLKAIKFSDRAVGPLTEAAFGRAIRNPRYRANAEVNSLTASRDLRALVEENLLDCFGEKRGRYYKASKELLAIRDKHRQPKEVPDPFTLI